MVVEVGNYSEQVEWDLDDDDEEEAKGPSAGESYKPEDQVPGTVAAASALPQAATDVSATATTAVIPVTTTTTVTPARATTITPARATTITAKSSTPSSEESFEIVAAPVAEESTDSNPSTSSHNEVSQTETTAAKSNSIAEDWEKWE